MITADPDRGRFTLNPEYYVMKHFARFVRPGAACRRLAGPWQAMSVAFRNPDGRDTLVIANPFAQRENLIIAHGATRFGVELPARSVNTFVI